MSAQKHSYMLRKLLLMPKLTEICAKKGQGAPPASYMMCAPMIGFIHRSTWKAKLTFSSPVTHLLVWDGLNIECTGNVCLFENRGYMEGIPLKIDFLMDMNKVMDFVPDLVALTVNECVYI